LRLWVTGLAILEQRAPYAHHLRGRGLYQSRLCKLRKCGPLIWREVDLGQSSSSEVLTQNVSSEMPSLTTT